MNHVLALAGDTVDPALADGFGQRVYTVDPDVGDDVELLELAPSLVEHGGFVAALGERVARLAGVRHASYAHLRRLDRPASNRLVLVSERTPGWRLSELLSAAAASGAPPPDTTVVFSILRQLLPAVALFSRPNRDLAIGALAPERLILTPQARLVIVEHAFGSALEKLNLGRDRLWRDFRIAMPPSAGLPRANARADATAIGVVALSLLLGRVLTPDEFPGGLQALVDSVSERREGEAVPLSPGLSRWLSRALQFDVRNAFQSPHEAQIAFETVLISERAYVTTQGTLEAWLKTVGGGIDRERGSREPGVGRRESDQVPAAPDAPDGIRGTAPAAPEAPEARVAPASVPRVLVLALAGLVVVLLGAVAWLWTRPTTAALAVGEGELVVQSRPASAHVSIDGQDRGMTPLTLRLPAGAHVLEVQVGDSEPRVIPLEIRPGVQTDQYIELQGVPTTGGLDVRSEPSGARVTVDGRSHGSTPVTLRDLSPGDHEVLVELGSRKAKQVVHVEAGVTAPLVVPLPKR